MIGLNQLDGNITGGIIHIFSHAFFKSLLFLSAGVIINTYKEKDTTLIRGMFRELPLVSIAVIVGFLSISGMPLFSGYLSKSIIKYGLEYNSVIYALHFIDVLTITYFMRILQIFKEPKDLKVKYKLNQKINSEIPIIILSLLSIILGIFYKPIWEFFLKTSIDFIELFIFKEWLIYFSKLIIGYLIYKMIIEKDFNLIVRIRKINITFPNTNYLFIIFITIMLVWKL
jgi:multicomponent Na+:H+ antiporter subunit D